MDDGRSMRAMEITPAASLNAGKEVALVGRAQASLVSQSLNESAKNSESYLNAGDQIFVLLGYTITHRRAKIWRDKAGLV